MRKLTLVFATLFVLTSLSFSQNFATKGTVELGGSLGFSSTTSVFDGNSGGDALSTIMLQPYIGYFVVNSFELGLIPSLISMFAGNQSQTNFGIYVAPAWNFDLRSNLFPFIEGKIGYNTASYDDGVSITDDPSSSGLAWGLRGGVKVRVGNSALVILALSYDQITMNRSGWNGGRNGQNIFGVNAGFTIFLGK